MFRSHMNSDQSLRFEPGCAWYDEVFAMAAKLRPEAELIHVCGHSHKLPAPYLFGKVTIVPVGYGKEEKAQRLLVMDYLDRSSWRTLDFDLATGRVLREEGVPVFAP